MTGNKRGDSRSATFVQRVLLPGGGGSFLSIEPRGRFVSNRIRTLGSLRDRASGSGHYDIRQEGSQTAREPDNQGLLPRVRAMKSFNLRLMSASRMDGVLCSSIRWPSEDSMTREGCSEWSSSPLPLSSKHRRTLLTGWGFSSMDSGSPGYCHLGGVCQVGGETTL